jgi:hypothetical protein
MKRLHVPPVAGFTSSVEGRQNLRASGRHLMGYLGATARSKKGTLSVMAVDYTTDDLACVVRYALATTRATAICPFHENITIRVGDDAAETHAYLRAIRITKSDGTPCEHEALCSEISRQLGEAADGVCPECAALRN